MESRVKVVGRGVIRWLQSHSLAIVVVMSLLHIGLTYMHTRVSGRADFFPLLR